MTGLLNPKSLDNRSFFRTIFDVYLGFMQKKQVYFLFQISFWAKKDMYTCIMSKPPKVRNLREKSGAPLS